VGLVRVITDRLAVLGTSRAVSPEQKYGQLNSLYRRVEACGLFDPDVYLARHEDIRNAGEDPWWHFLRHGLEEGRQFTSPESAAAALARAQQEIAEARRKAPGTTPGIADQTACAANKLRNRAARIAIYCSRQGNFYMAEIADLLLLGLQSCGVNAVRRDEEADQAETFDIRIFVAPHEFFYLGAGKDWEKYVMHAGTVLFNVEQVQTEWFCRSFRLLLKAPLVIDLNIHTVAILQKLGCNAVFFMPGHLDDTAYTTPITDISNIGLMKGYKFSKEEFDWTQQNSLSARPIDVLFIGARTPYRENTLSRLADLSSVCRFVCVVRDALKPFTAVDTNGAAVEMNWALSQRSKISLNLHRDWTGYFEWSRMVLRGFWQGACVVTDRGLASPIFDAGTHYLEESRRHLSELITWLLSTQDGRAKLETTARLGYERATTHGAMPLALSPVLDAFCQLLGL
jgi:hypothetical protein